MDLKRSKNWTKGTGWNELIKIKDPRKASKYIRDNWVRPAKATERADYREGEAEKWFNEKQKSPQTMGYDSEVEFDTDNIKFKSKQRFTVFCNEYRDVYGNIPGNDQT